MAFAQAEIRHNFGERKKIKELFYGQLFFKMEGVLSWGTSDEQRFVAGGAEGMKNIHDIFFLAEETFKMFHDFLSSKDYNA
jgi:hypothetical protein